MKTFTAKQFSNQPAQVFREADTNGSVKINHDRYPDKVFILEGRDRGMNDLEDKKLYVFGEQTIETVKKEDKE